MQDACPQAQAYLKRKNRYRPKQKGWQTFEQQLSKDEYDKSAKNKQNMDLEKDTNGCLEVHVKETMLFVVDI